MLRANEILPHHRFARSLGGPLVRVQGTIAHVFGGPAHHHGANHQHFRVRINKVLRLAGGETAVAENMVGTEVFVATRFGDDEGLAQEIPDLQEGSQVEVQGEYVSQAAAFPTEDNQNPVLAVVHFTHHPVGFVLYEDEYYS